jgi:hypothetical protein
LGEPLQHLLPTGDSLFGKYFLEVGGEFAEALIEVSHPELHGALLSAS